MKIVREMKALAICCALMIFFSSVPCAHAQGAETEYLVPLGMTAGIKMISEGVIIVGISEVETDSGGKSPAKSAGLCIGDVITEINSQKINSAQTLRDAVNRGGEMTLKYVRGGEECITTIVPAKETGGQWKLGVWARDSIAGIGTLTYYDPDTGAFGALGHGISDTGTASLMPLASGSLVKSSVSSVRRGEAGSPGELRGEFDINCEYGVLFTNTEHGIFGTLDFSALTTSAQALEVARPEEVKEGKATILSNVEGNKVEEYEIEIKKVYSDSSHSPRDMTIEVTDSRLIELTGGIVQGMSGSPIIQDGKFVGAVTHVLINSPTQGYGIFLQNMMDDEAEMLKKAA